MKTATASTRTLATRELHRIAPGTRLRVYLAYGAFVCEGTLIETIRWGGGDETVVLRVDGTRRNFTADLYIFLGPPPTTAHMHAPMKALAIAILAGTLAAAAVVVGLIAVGVIR